jgi:GTP-binding protein
MRNSIKRKTGGKRQFPSKSHDKISQDGPAFLSSAAYYKDLPKPESIEYCIIGRSNVGKSSFINHVLEKKRLARVSKTPGKTDLANFYRINNKMIWVDLPGYGYAKASQKEKLRWSKLIRSYCEKREILFGIIWLIDIRHIGLNADIEAYNWFCTLGIPVFPVITKSDKLPQSKRIRHKREIESFFQFNVPAAVYSTNKNSSRKEFWKRFNTWREAIENMRT